MKINGSILTDAMKYNHIQFKDDQMKIHNYDAESVGIIKTFQLDEPTKKEMDFVLNEKDYKFISKLGMIDVKLTDKHIKIESKGNKFNFALMKDYPTFEVDLDNAQEIAIDYDALSKASSFVGDGKTAPQYAGVNVLNGVVLATNRAAIMRKRFDNPTGIEVNIPGNIIKYIDDVVGLKFKANKKFLLCEHDGHLMYSTLIENKLSDKEIKLNTVYSFVVNRNELANELKLIRDYSEVAKTRIEDGCLNLKVSTNEQTFEIKVDVTSHQGNQLIQNFSIKNLLLILNAVEIEDVKVEVSDMALRIYDDAKETEFLLPRYGAIEKEW